MLVLLLCGHMRALRREARSAGARRGHKDPERTTAARSYRFSVHRSPPGGMGHGCAKFQASTVGLTSLPVTG